MEGGETLRDNSNLDVRIPFRDAAKSFSAAEMPLELTLHDRITRQVRLRETPSWGRPGKSVLMGLSHTDSPRMYAKQSEQADFGI